MRVGKKCLYHRVSFESKSILNLLTPDMTCAIIGCVEIEKTCPFVRTGKGHKGLREISTVKTYPSLKKF